MKHSTTRKTESPPSTASSPPPLEKRMKATSTKTSKWMVLSQLSRRRYNCCCAPLSSSSVGGMVLLIGSSVLLVSIFCFGGGNRSFLLPPSAEAVQPIDHRPLLQSSSTTTATTAAAGRTREAAESTTTTTTTKDAAVKSSTTVASSSVDAHAPQQQQQEPVDGDSSSVESSSFLSSDELRSRIEYLRGDDERLVRWDATRTTAKRQHRGGCDDLPAALNILSRCDDASSCTYEQKGLVCQYATFCITDNPEQRALFSNHDDNIHKATIQLLIDAHEEYPWASAMAGHLIYIASFSNEKNHQTFMQLGAVQQLSAVVKSSDSTPLQIMWAAAALQNVAASYCNTYNDGRCYWKWHRQRSQQIIEQSSLPIISDGKQARDEMLQDVDLVNRLGQYACMGPVTGRSSASNPFPGENAVYGRDDDSTNIIAWAAAGALKNLALNAAARDVIDPVMPCVCMLARSKDWLERNKGEAVLGHVRRSDPCWMISSSSEQRTTVSCVDRYFLDVEGYDCSDYVHANEEECSANDSTTAISASDACCPCGGGDRQENETEDNE